MTTSLVVTSSHDQDEVDLDPDLRRLVHFDPMLDHRLSRANAYDHLVDEEQQPYRQAGKENSKSNNDKSGLDGEQGQGEEGEEALQTDRPYVLMVYNTAAAGLNIDGIWNLFSKHGRVIDVDLPKRDLGWCKVTFGSHMEAQSAIQALDRTPQWNLVVKHAWTDEERRRNKGERATTTNDDSKESPAERYVPGGRSKQLQDFARSRSVVGRPRYFALLDEAARAKSLARQKRRRGVKPKKVVYSSASEKEEDEDASAEDALKMLQNDPAKLQVKEFGRPLLLPFSVPEDCHHCCQPGRLRCSRCKTWYCSLNCQIQDWPSHEGDCKEEVTEESANSTIADEEESFVSADKTSTAAVAAAPSEKLGCMKSILQFSQSGSVVDFFSRDAAVRRSTDCFTAMALEDEEAGLYVMVTMQAEIDQEKALAKVAEGEFVAYAGKMDDEEMFFRGFVLDIADETATLLCIDNGEIDVCPLSRVCPLPTAAMSHPALAVRFMSDNKLRPEMQELVRRSLDQMTSVRAEYKEVQVDMNGRCEALVALLDKDDEKLVLYRLQDWTSIDGRVSKLLGFSKPKLMASDVPKYEIGDGDDVFFLECGRTTDLVVVQSVGCCCGDKVDSLAEVMRTELDRERIPVGEPKKGELVASRWSKLEEDDDTYFRAEILSVDPLRRLARVRFVDYGLSSIESLDHFVRVPERAMLKQFPIFTQVFKMVDVPSLSSARADIKVRLKHLRPQLGVVVKLHIVNDDTSEPKAIRLEHPNGKTLNEMMKLKLTETDESLGSGDMQGMCPGGVFEYNRCHVAELAVRPSPVSQPVVILHAEDPLNIFVSPLDQISAASNLADRIADRVNRTVNNGGLYGPPIGKVCLARAPSDGEWYRGVCLRELYLESDVEANSIFFPDFGFAENVLRMDVRHMSDDLMETPFLANHCALEGFNAEDEEMVERGAQLLQKRLLPFEEVSVVVVRREKGHFVIRIPSLEKELKDIAESR